MLRYVILAKSPIVSSTSMGPALVPAAARGSTGCCRESRAPRGRTNVEAVGSCPLFQRVLDRGESLFDELADATGEVVGKQVGGPDEPRGGLSVRDDLRGRVVMRKAERTVGDRPRKAPGPVVGAHEQLADDRAVEESDHPIPSVDPGIAHKPGSQPFMNGPPVAQGVPGDLWIHVDAGLPDDTSHIPSSAFWADAQPLPARFGPMPGNRPRQSRWPLPRRESQDSRTAGPPPRDHAGAGPWPRRPLTEAWQQN